ncbi:hypothetical protein SDC9_62964 [bioreactor metagenome]|uniref:Uncharacterized protein n=1 Tax=bioreactor metagenome TaxID=1076179 RepID=A0A644XQQ3_9ZZZZ
MHEDPGRRRREDHRVDAIGDSPVPGQEVPHVLDAEVTLHQRLDQISQNSRPHQHQADQDADPPGAAEDEVTDDSGEGGAQQHRAGESLPGLLRADRGRHRMAAEQHAEHVATRVGADHGAQPQEHPGSTPGLPHQQADERAHQRQVGDDQHARRRVLDEPLGPPGQADEKGGEHRQPETHQQVGGGVAGGQAEDEERAGHHRHQADLDDQQGRGHPDLAQGLVHLHHGHPDQGGGEDDEPRHPPQQARDQQGRQDDPHHDGGRQVPTGSARSGGAGWLPRTGLDGACR